DCAGKLRRKLQPAGTGIGSDHIVEARLIDRHLTAFQRGDLRPVPVDADHLMAEIGETGAGNKADIAGADHGDAHGSSVMKVTNRSRSKPRLHSKRRPQWREAWDN